MVTIVSVFRCEICGNRHDQLDDAISCELKGVEKIWVKEGQEVKRVDNEPWHFYVTDRSGRYEHETDFAVAKNIRVAQHSIIVDIWFRPRDRAPAMMLQGYSQRHLCRFNIPTVPLEDRKQ